MKYYYNNQTGESTWVKPDSLKDKNKQPRQFDSKEEEDDYKEKKAAKKVQKKKMAEDRKEKVEKMKEDRKAKDEEKKREEEERKRQKVHIWFINQIDIYGFELKLSDTTYYWMMIFINTCILLHDMIETRGRRTKKRGRRTKKGR